MSRARRSSGPNARLRDKRTTRGWSQNAVADVMHRVAADLALPEPRGIDASYVSRWERGVVPEPYHGYLLCKAFGMSPAELGLPSWYMPGVEAQDQPRPSSSTTGFGLPAHRLDWTAPAVPFDYDRWLRTVSQGVVPGEGGTAGGDVDAAAMHAFRMADRQVGGGHLYATVVRYLHVDLGPRLLGGSASDDQRMFSAAAALTEMAGWMGHDMGLDSHAKQPFSRAWSLARAGAEAEVRAHVLGSLSLSHIHI